MYSLYINIVREYTEDVHEWTPFKVSDFCNFLINKLL